MMKSLIYLSLILGSLSTFSQTGPPTQINYQGVARRASGSTINSQALGIKFRILQGSTSGTAVFTESQSQSTNGLGLFTAQIGSQSNGLATVNWANGPFFLEVSVDTTGGNSYVLLGTQQLVSVPYALAAGTVMNPSLSYNNSILSVGLSTVTIAASGSSPSLTINGNTLTIAGGNSVPLPASGFTNVTSSGATTTLSIPGGVNLHTDSVTISPLAYFGFLDGIAQVIGSYPNYTIAVAPVINYNQSTGLLTLSSSPTIAATPYSWSYNITPALSISNGTALISGPSSNSVDISNASPWRQSPTVPTVTLASAALNTSVGINNPPNLVPSAHLEVNGYTKLGSPSAPAIQMSMTTATMPSSASGTTSISMSSYTLSKIISITVMVDVSSNSSGLWMPPGFSGLVSAGYEYYWKISGTPNTLDLITTAANSANVLNKTAKIVITYGP